MIYLSWDEAIRVEAAAPTLLDRLIVRLPLWVGMRAHEVSDARIEHVDPEQGLIYIPWGHRNGARLSCIDDGTLQLLATFTGPRKKGPLLCKWDGCLLGRWNVYYAIHVCGELAGIHKAKPIGPTMLRHTFATTWLKRKGNIRLLQKQLGHAKLESTAYYLDWIPEEVKEEYDELFNRGEKVAATVPA